MREGLAEAAQARVKSVTKPKKRQGIFNPTVKLDTSQVVDRRKPSWYNYQTDQGPKKSFSKKLYPKRYEDGSVG
jgi:hypothetical protein